MADFRPGVPLRRSAEKGFPQTFWGKSRLKFLEGCVLMRVLRKTSENPFKPGVGARHPSDAERRLIREMQHSRFQDGTRGLEESTQALSLQKEPSYA